MFFLNNTKWAMRAALLVPPPPPLPSLIIESCSTFYMQASKQAQITGQWKLLMNPPRPPTHSDHTHLYLVSKLLPTLSHVLLRKGPSPPSSQRRFLSVGVSFTTKLSQGTRVTRVTGHAGDS